MSAPVEKKFSLCVEMGPTCSCVYRFSDVGTRDNVAKEAELWPGVTKITVASVEQETRYNKESEAEPILLLTPITVRKYLQK